MEHGKSDSTGARNVETSVLPEIEIKYLVLLHYQLEPAEHEPCIQ